MDEPLQRCITSVGPTVAALMGAPYEYGTDAPHEALLSLAGGKIDRAVPKRCDEGCGTVSRR